MYEVRGDTNEDFEVYSPVSGIWNLDLVRWTNQNNLRFIFWIVVMIIIVTIIVIIILIIIINNKNKSNIMIMMIIKLSS